MGYDLETGGTEKAPQSDEEYLLACLGDYKMNQGKLKNLMDIRVGFDGGADARGIGEVEYALESLKERIIKTAEKVGKDGLALIVEADEDVRQSMEKSKANR